MTSDRGGWRTQIADAADAANEAVNDWAGGYDPSAVADPTHVDEDPTGDQDDGTPDDPATDAVDIVEAGAAEAETGSDVERTDERPIRVEAYRAWIGDPPDPLSAPVSELRTTIFDIVTVEQPVTASRVRSLLLRDRSRSGDRGKLRLERVTTVIAEIIAEGELEVIREQDDGMLESAVLVLQGHRPRSCRELGPRAAADVPLIELGAGVARVRERFRGVDKARARDILLRTCIGISPVRAAIGQRFDRAWIGDLGALSGGENAQLAVSSGKVEVAGDALLEAAASDPLAVVGMVARLVRNDKTLSEWHGLLRVAALRGELRAVEALIELPVDDLDTSFDDRIHWIRVGADHGVPSALRRALLLSDRHEGVYPAEAVSAWEALRRVRAGAMPNAGALSPAVLRRYNGVLLRDRMRRVRGYRLPEWRELDAWDWSIWTRVRDTLKRTTPAGLVDIRDLVGERPMTQELAVQLAEHLRHFGRDMVPDPRYELLGPTSGGVVHVARTSGTPPCDRSYRAAAVMVRIGAGTAAVDGRSHPSEVSKLDTIIEDMALDPGPTSRLKRLAEVVLARPGDVVDDLREFSGKLDRDQLRDLLVSVAAADGILHPMERELLRLATEQLHLDEDLVALVERRTG